MNSQQVPAIDFATLELLPYGIIVLDGDGTVLHYNAREEEIANRSREGVLGRNFFSEIAPCTQVAEFHGQFLEIMRSEGATAEFRFHFPFAGRPRDVEVALTAFRYASELLCLVSIRDVSEEERIRSAIVSAEVLSDIGEVASGVAHNFNNLLMAIGTWVSVLKRQIPAGSPSEKALAQISAAVSDGSEMVRRITDMTRERGRETTSLPVDLNEVARDAMEQAVPRVERNRADGHQIDLRSILHAELARVTGFASELREVALNLIANAIDAIEGDGTVTVRTFNEENSVVLAVEDTGMGMSQETQRKLFRPLFTTKQDRGTGLGLSTSFGIIRRHGGEFRVQSEPGQGSVFSIVLPQARPAIGVTRE